MRLDVFRVHVEKKSVLNSNSILKIGEKSFRFVFRYDVIQTRAKSTVFPHPSFQKNF